jgi:Spy/CpxP family protein refolding chaperone
MEKAVKLTPDQKKAMTEIIEARDRAMRDFQAENAEELKAAGAAMVEAVKSRDKEAIFKAQKTYLELYAPMHEMMKDSQTKLTNVLTPQQKAELHEYQVMTAVKNMIAPVELSDQQIKQVKASCQEGDLNSFGGNLYQVIQQVLTPEQKAAIARHRGIGYVRAMFARANLTADQWKQVEAACDELAADLPPLNDAKFYTKLAEKVNGLLTDGQKAAMKKAQRSWGRAGGAPGSPMPGAPVGGGIKAPEKKE